MRVGRVEITSRNVRRRMLWGTIVLCWFGGVVAGFVWLANYDNRPGTAATAPAHWPLESRIARDLNGPTLVMLAHPRCSCTRASLAELAELMGRAVQAPRAYVVFVMPAGVDSSWDHTELKEIAAGIPHVISVEDHDGVEAGRFGAVTSGQVLLYDASGALVYSGGTTGSRGHVGDNDGRATILALLNHEPSDRSTASVFGCPLLATDLSEEYTMKEAAHGVASN